ncbi:unnamed protein product, partial [Laminaria digitata]
MKFLMYQVDVRLQVLYLLLVLVRSQALLLYSRVRRSKRRSKGAKYGKASVAAVFTVCRTRSLKLSGDPSQKRCCSGKDDLFPVIFPSNRQNPGSICLFLSFTSASQSLTSPGSSCDHVTTRPHF